MQKPKYLHKIEISTKTEIFYKNTQFLQNFESCIKNLYNKK